MVKTVLKGDQQFQRENKCLRTKVWQRVRPTVSKGEQKGEKKFEKKRFKGRPTVSKGEQKFVNKSLAKGETNSFKGRQTVSNVKGRT